MRLMKKSKLVAEPGYFRSCFARFLLLSTQILSGSSFFCLCPRSLVLLRRPCYEMDTSTESDGDSAHWSRWAFESILQVRAFGTAAGRYALVSGSGDGRDAKDDDCGGAFDSGLGQARCLDRGGANESRGERRHSSILDVAWHHHQRGPTDPRHSTRTWYL